MLFKAVLIGPGCEMWSMSCRFTCFSQHCAITKWIVPDLLALPGILSYISLLQIHSTRAWSLTAVMCIYRPPFSPFIKPKDSAFVFHTARAILLSIFEQGVVRSGGEKSGFLLVARSHTHRLSNSSCSQSTDEHMEIDSRVKSKSNENPNHTPQTHSTHESGGLGEREHLQRHRSVR